MNRRPRRQPMKTWRLRSCRYTTELVRIISDVANPVYTRGPTIRDASQRRTQTDPDTTTRARRLAVPPPTWLPLPAGPALILTLGSASAPIAALSPRRRAVSCWRERSGSGACITSASSRGREASGSGPLVATARSPASAIRCTRQHRAVGRLRAERAARLARAGRSSCCSVEYHAIVRWEEAARIAPWRRYRDTGARAAVAAGVDRGERNRRSDDRGAELLSEAELTRVQRARGKRRALVARRRCSASAGRSWPCALRAYLVCCGLKALVS